MGLSEMNSICSDLEKEQQGEYGYLKLSAGSIEDQ